MERPQLNEIRDSKEFRSYYYLLAELKEYCKMNGLPVSGGKQEINDRIACFIDTGEVLRPVAKSRTAKRMTEITFDSTIEPDIRCSEVHRRFFEEAIGPSFIFPVAFQKWLKDNAGKTYREAVAAYDEIREERRSRPTVIDRQFEYNTYIRDFFADNPGHQLEAAIRCWKYKKSRPGHNRYEASDLDHEEDTE